MKKTVLGAAMIILGTMPALAQQRDLGAGAMQRPGDYSFQGGEAVYVIV